MWEKHKIDIVSYKRVWQEIKEYHDTEAEKHNKMKTTMKLNTQTQKFWRSEQFEIDIKKEYFDFAKSKLLRTLFKLITCIIVRRMREKAGK